MMGRTTICPLTTTARSVMLCIPEEEKERSEGRVSSGVAREGVAKQGRYREERTENGSLGKVDDGSTEEGTEDTSVGAENDRGKKGEQERSARARTPSFTHES